MLNLVCRTRKSFNENSLENNEDVYSIANIPGIQSVRKAVIEGREEASRPAGTSKGRQKCKIV
jgi:hypothetical protein